MRGHRGSRQLVRDAGLGFLEAVLFEPFRQSVIGRASPLQFGFQVPGGAFRPELRITRITELRITQLRNYELR